MKDAVTELLNKKVGGEYLKYRNGMAHPNKYNHTNKKTISNEYIKYEKKILTKEASKLFNQKVENDLRILLGKGK